MALPLLILRPRSTGTREPAPAAAPAPLPGSKWSAREIEELEARYANEPTRAIADDLGRSRASVYTQASLRGLQKSRAYLQQQGLVHVLNIKPAAARRTQFPPGHTPWNRK